MYYNSNTSKFRCYEGGSWKDCDNNAVNTLQAAYNGGATITTAGATNIAYTLTSGNFNVSGAGAVNLTPTSASQFTSSGALTLTGGAASTWSTAAGNLNITGAGALAMQGGAASSFATTAGNITLQAAGSGTTANVQIGSGAGSATPDMLVFDIKNTAGDPAGTNGAMYYNSNTGKLRCYENAAWKDCDTTAAASTLQTAYNNGATITTAGAVNIAYTLTGGNFNVSGGGSVNLTPTSASQFTSGGALTFTGGAASTWSTSAGNLTLQAGSGTVSLGTSTSLTANGALTLTSGAATGLSIDSGTTGTLSIGTDASAETINIATGAAVKTTTVGSTNSTSTTTVQSGSGNVILESRGSGVTGNVQIGGVTGATPDLLVLDTKNTAGDPSGVNGAIYYNSNTSKFRCYQNGAWTNCVGGGSKQFLVDAPQAVQEPDGSSNDVDSWKLYDYTDKDQYNRTYGNAATQDLDVVYQMLLPTDFISWDTSSAIAVTYKTSSATTTTSKVSCAVYDTAGALSYTAPDAASVTKATITITSANLAGTWTAGSPFVVVCKGTVNAAATADVGKVVLKYNY
jgi:hypothetical protein